MSQNPKTAARRTHSDSLSKEAPLLQIELEETLVHLKTILMLAQLNSAYYQLKLNLMKVSNKLQQKYFASKMDAFMAIQNYRYQYYPKNKQLVGIQKTSRVGHSGEQCEGENGQNLLKVFEKYKRRADYQQIATYTTIKYQNKLLWIINLFISKNKMLASHALCRLEQHREISATHLQSEKSSKIETNDSQKTKLFRRSMDKKDNRKSFSVQKSGLAPRNEYFMPVKYQPSILSSQTSPKNGEKPVVENQNVSSLMHRFLQNMEDRTKERRNNLQLNREKKQNKHSSTQKQNSSLIKLQKELKINQLEYLKRKYKKLMDQFGCFSQRFLKVIEQQEYMQ